MNKKLKILHLEDLPSDAELVERELKKGNIQFEKLIVDNKKDFEKALNEFLPDIILSDHSLPSFNSVQAFQIVKNLGISVPFILITSTISEEFAVEVMKSGVYDYILKDRLQRLPNAVLNAIEKSKVENEKQRANERLLKANRLYYFISQINQSIVHIKDEETLINNACRIAMDFGKFKMAWIGMFDMANKKIMLAGHNGIPADEIKLFNNVPYQKKGPLDYVLSTGTYYICNDIQHDLELESWRPFAAKHGIQSCIALPIRKSGNIIGAFNLYATELNFFDDDEIKLLVEATGDISFAFDLYDKEKKHKATEELVIKNEKRFRALVENGADAVVILTAEGKPFYISPTVKNVLGYTEAETLQLDLFTMFHPDDVAWAAKVWEQVLISPGVSIPVRPSRMIHKDGTWRWLEGTLTNLLHDPALNGIVDNFRDVTERKNAEDALDKSEERYRQIVETTREAIWMIDENNKTVFVNKRFTELFGYSIDEMLSKTNFDLMDDEGKAIAKEKMENRKIGIAEDFELPYISKNGNKIWTHLSASPITDENRKYMGAIAMISDISEKRNNQMEKEKITSDIIKRNNDLEQFSYIVSHNLRAPIANIMGLNDLMKSATISAEQKEMCSNELSKSVNKLDAVINDLNNILQVKNQLSEKRESIKLTALAKDVFYSINKLVEVNHVIFSFDFKVETMRTIRTYLHSIFYNLISNSIKYRNRTIDPVIEIGSRWEDDKIILTFKDNGLGIDMTARGEQIFGLYKRFHTEHAEGKGMGLYMVKTQVESLGGKISVISEPGSGTIFTIEFPESRDWETDTSEN